MIQRPQLTLQPGSSLNEVRPRRPEQSAQRRSQPRRRPGLNEVRPRRPEQSNTVRWLLAALFVSMKSGLEGRNNSLSAQWDADPS